ncbi:MAG: T9SS type A sorting domain-containing protein [Patescibacteria group bacterium]|jgi:hypothetical protein
MFLNKLFLVVPSLIKKFRRWDPAIAVIVLSVLFSNSVLAFSDSACGWIGLTKANAPATIQNLQYDDWLKDTAVINVSQEHGSFNSQASIKFIDRAGGGVYGRMICMKVYNPPIQIKKPFSILAEVKGFSDSAYKIRVMFKIISNGELFEQSQENFTDTSWVAASNGPLRGRLCPDSICRAIDTLMFTLWMSKANYWPYGFYLDNLRYKTDDSTVFFDSCGEDDVAIEEAVKVRDLMDVSVFPNPFTLFVRVDNAPKNSKMDIVDLTGRVVKTLTEPFWNGCDAMGRKLPTGAYFLRVKTEKTTTMKKIVLMR